MTIGELLSDLSSVELPPDVAARTATGIAYDSRRVAPGAVFVALRGLKADGLTFAPQAEARGAAVIVADRPRPDGIRTAWVEVPNARVALAELADRFFGHPSGRLRAVGITGTNGKTTTAYLLRAIFEAAGWRCGLLGTVVYSFGGQDRPADRTTPEAPDLQQMLRRMVDEGCAAAVMEVSSHALALHRVDAMTFAAGVFTNLTRDHLDFHKDMESYFAAKRRLFEMLPADAPAVVNLDDPRGSVLAGISRRPVTYAIRAKADVTPEPFELSLGGLSFTARTPRGRVQVKSRLVGRPNVSNILAAVATSVALDVPTDAIEEGLAGQPGVPGRFEVVHAGESDVTVVVDYAHTDDALKNLLETARALAPSRLVTVFGCGGDRDKTKRPLMGAVAGRLSDVVVITSDNPRSEDQLRIIEEVRRGVPAPSRNNGRPGPGSPEVIVQVDRREAIGKAIEEARAGDLVVIAGKGHEKTQVIGDRVLPFDDVTVAREAIERRQRRLRVG